MNRAVWLVTIAAVAFVPAALAARSPTLAEREAITRAMPAFFRNAPVECIWLNIRVSRNPRYARVAPQVLNWRQRGSRCIHYATNGFYILKKARRWRIIYNGSDSPRCSLGVPRDLVICRP